MERNDKGFISLGVDTLLLVLFIVLKLCGVIDWSWLWVFSPIWLPLGFYLLIMLVLVTITKTIK